MLIYNQEQNKKTIISPRAPKLIRHKFQHKLTSVNKKFLKSIGLKLKNKNVKY